MEMLVRTGIETAEQRESSLLRQREPLRTWAGRGTGVTCSGCGEPIQAHEVEYEVEMRRGADAATLSFHLPCYRNWSSRGSR